MEDILQQLIKEATGTKLNHLRNGAQNALGNIDSHKMARKLFNCFDLQTNYIVSMESIEIHHMI